MSRLAAGLGSLIFLLVAPGTVAGIIPWWISQWRPKPSVFDVRWLAYVGAALVVCGLLALLESFARFALQGLGTPAPVLPTRHLVVTGLYRYVRNPMYVAVVMLILGQALMLADGRLLAYAALVWGCFHAFVLWYEEPTLRRAFGSEYQDYCANVRRWLPRLRPWTISTGARDRP